MMHPMGFMPEMYVDENTYIRDDRFIIQPASNGYVVTYSVPVTIKRKMGDKTVRKIEWKKKKIVCKNIDEVIEHLSEFEMYIIFKDKIGE